MMDGQVLMERLLPVEIVGVRQRISGIDFAGIGSSVEPDLVERSLSSVPGYVA